MKYEVEFIDTANKCTSTLKNIKEKARGYPLAIDTETTGLDPLTYDILLLQIGIPQYQIVIDWQKCIQNNNLNRDLLRSILENEDQPLFLQNAKFDYKGIKQKTGIEMNAMRDTMIAAHLIRAGLQRNGFDLASLMDDYGIVVMDKGVRQTFENHKGSFTPEQIEYSAMDVRYLHKLHDILMKDIRELGLDSLYNLECNTIPVTGDMELNGIKVDYKKWTELEVLSKKEKVIARKKLDSFFMDLVQKDLFGDPIINYNSPTQLKPLLEKIIGYKLSGTGKDVIKEIEHPVGKALLDYRKAQKAISTYGSKFYSENVRAETGYRIHSNFIQTNGTETGRYASRKVNLQNIPAKAEYRAAFVAEKGYKIIGSDYSSFEVAILSELANDKEFKKIFEYGLDPHGFTSSMLFGKPVRTAGKKYIDENGEVHTSDVTKNKDLRKAGKALLFGILYGMGPRRLAENLKIPLNDARNLINKFFTLFPGIKSFMDKSVSQGLAEKACINPIDRRVRWLTGNIRKPKSKAHMEAQLRNYPMQSTNASAIKRALILVKEAIVRNGWREDVKILLTVHKLHCAH